MTGWWPLALTLSFAVVAGYVASALPGRRARRVSREPTFGICRGARSL